MTRYRVEFGWGDRQQALYAHFEADSEPEAQVIAVALLNRIGINGAWSGGETQAAPGGPVSLGEPVDASNWARRGIGM